MKARQVRERQYRRIFVAGIGVSVVVHGVVLGMSTFQVPASTAGDDDASRTARPQEARFRAIELVELSPLEEPVEALVPTEVEAVPASSEPAPATPPPAGATPAPASGASAPAIDAATLLASLGTPSAPTMRANFAAQRSLPYGSSASQAIPVLVGEDSHEGHDHGGEEESDGTGWWGRFKVALGQGAGGHCKPRKPPVVVSGPNLPPVLGGTQPEDETTPPDAQFPRPRGPRGRAF